MSASSTLGQYLVDGSGRTLYWVTGDAKGVSNMPASLLAIWPVFHISSFVVPSSLKASDFGSITRNDGSEQTTYKEWPLYYFVGDSAAGQTNGEGLVDEGGTWSVVDPSASGPEAVPTTTPTAASAY